MTRDSTVSTFARAPNALAQCTARGIVSRSALADARSETVAAIWRAWRLAVCTAVLSVALFAPAFAAPMRTVAVLYDDSGSMGGSAEAGRWVGANFSMQVFAALLAASDELLLVKMNAQPTVKRYSGVGDIDAVIADFQREGPPTNGTPYAGMSALIAALEQSASKEKWLIVLTDGGFDSVTDAVVNRDVDAAKRLGVKAVFMLIQQGAGHAVAEYWKRNAGAQIINADSARDVPSKVESIAQLLMGRDTTSAGIDVKITGDSLTVSSKFPLRGLVLLRQGERGITVTAAQAGSASMTVRAHNVTSRAELAGFPSDYRAAASVIPKKAYVAHLSSSGVIGSGDNVVSVRFNGPLSGSRLKVYPEVAARMDVRVLGTTGKDLMKDGDGFFTLCQGDAATVQTSLTQPTGGAVTIGRNDIAQFDVGLRDASGSNIAMSLDPTQSFFSTKVTPTTELHLNPFARYPGYFHFQGETLKLRSKVCKREVIIRVKSGLNSDGRWTSRVDQLSAASPIRLSVEIDGRLATQQDLASWQWRNDLGGDWRFRVDGQDLVLEPRPGCCALTWGRPKAHVGRFEIRSLDTGNTRDVIKPMPPIEYEFVLPADSWARLWWLYGCPIAALLAMLGLLWYLWRVAVVKERFASSSVLHKDSRGRWTRIPFNRPSTFLSRWLWPSKRESRVLEGMRFYAVGRRGSSVLLDGKSLGKLHEIDGWEYDELLAEKRKPQRSARITHQQDIIRLRSIGGRIAERDVRYQYSRTSEAATWRK